jgi:hypothetical protein
LDFFNIWTVVVVAIVGYYLIEYKKIDNKKEVKQTELKNKDILKPTDIEPIFVHSEQLHVLLGIEKQDVEDFLRQHSDDIKTFAFNGNKYYSSENIKKLFTNSKKPII